MFDRAGVAAVGAADEGAVAGADEGVVAATAAAAAAAYLIGGRVTVPEAWRDVGWAGV